MKGIFVDDPIARITFISVKFFPIRPNPPDPPNPRSKKVWLIAKLIPHG